MVSGERPAVREVEGRPGHSSKDSTSSSLSKSLIHVCFDERERETHE